MSGSARYVWDPAKAAANKRRHGISFETAIRVFADPFHVSEQDRIEGAEYRWQTLGIVEGFTLLLVAHKWTDADGIEIIRIISARRAEKRERKRHEQ
ncbi:MAG: BrnT family toxin [Sphingopyxis sp.]|nr:BrnT family toxin [Sphingopyxis sp.]